MILVLMWSLAIPQRREEEILVNWPLNVVRTSIVYTLRIAVDWVPWGTHRTSWVVSSSAPPLEIFGTMIREIGPRPHTFHSYNLRWSSSEPNISTGVESYMCTYLSTLIFFIHMTKIFFGLVVTVRKCMHACKKNKISMLDTRRWADETFSIKYEYLNRGGENNFSLPTLRWTWFDSFNLSYAFVLNSSSSKHTVFCWIVRVMRDRKHSFVPSGLFFHGTPTSWSWASTPCVHPPIHHLYYHDFVLTVTEQIKS